MPFKEFCRLIIELDPNTNKSSLKNFFQDLLEGALNTYFEDQHKENINTSVIIGVRRVLRDEMKNFIRKIKSINLETKYDRDYVKAISNVLCRTIIETKYESDDKLFFYSDYNLHDEFLKTPVSVEKFANNLERKKQVSVNNSKKTFNK